MEEPLPLGTNGGTVGTTMDGVGPPLVGSKVEKMCTVEKGPLGSEPIDPVEGIPVMMGGIDTSPLPTIPPWKGSGCAPTMGLDGAVKKVGSD